VAIAHTRWATHGKLSTENAHPHFDHKLKCAVVHNGIIENYQEIRMLLSKRGIVFRSETDSEVISQLIGFLYRGNLLRAVQRTIPLLRGAFAVVVIHQSHPEEVVCAANESPLAIGIGAQEMFISSDPHAFLKYKNRVIQLYHAEIVRMTAESVHAYDSRSLPISKESEIVSLEEEEVSRGRFSHYMLKEIFEQPQTIQHAMLSRLSGHEVLLEELQLTDDELLAVQHITILACGSSYHAGMIAAHMLEERAHLSVSVEIASEYKYKHSILRPHTLVIAISQSGETADTLAVVRTLKKRGVKVVGICNVQGSTLCREVESSIFLRAGPEVSVAATKTFTSQLVVLTLLCMRFAYLRTLDNQEGREAVEALTRLPAQVCLLLEQEKQIETLAKKYAHYDHWFFLGRQNMYPTALEAALKLKEIAYVNANGMPGGEMKHGSIALVGPDCPILAFCAHRATYSKLLNNVLAAKARDCRVLAIAPAEAAGIDTIADDVLWVPSTRDELAPILSIIGAQLFAYYVAKERGTEIDRPRNLAKSVTVE
jgi:glucosamine--fructose-6-phosphate aminotransferase (isomerizing)